MFKPEEIYYEKSIKSYELGIQLLKKYENIPKKIIETHNNIEELRKKSNKDFPILKKKLIIGVRKTHKYSPNKKVSDFLVPYTSSGCTASCLYCYLVCHFNKCSYLRLFVNREQMLDKIIKTANASSNTKELTFEIGSNSDLILENSITNNLVWTIENFAKSPNGFLTFPTKFDMIDPLLNIPLGREKIIIRISMNPEKIIKATEFGTASLNARIRTINKLKEADYKVGIIIAPVIFIEDWKIQYHNLVEKLANELSDDVKKDVFFEVIFMTYSYVHNAINTEAYPNAINLYEQEKMKVRGRGMYTYKNSLRLEGEDYLKSIIYKYFPKNQILYFS